jgi:hypothetical protein
MAARGYTPADHQEGWSLLHKVSGLFEEDAPQETDLQVRDATTELDNTDEDLYRIVRAALTRLHPEQARFVLNGLEPTTGAGAILSVKNMLDRLDTLDKGRSKETAKADKAAIATLKQRGVTAAERARLRGLVDVAQSAPAVEPAAAPVDDGKYEADLSALRAWFEDWSEVARVAIKRKDYLIRLGLASRKSPAKPDDSPAT